ncbi:endo-1,4-beta-xylanase [Cellulomonas sp. zg-ZUI222]|uniref:Beta-xylanase n=1 Tax=Cellulomonas wangleii TaxID=2816956 RepID=A0ABX8DAW1_9CELL|nr:MULTISPECIES: endo-1,4-beta-xylanase [Cellulomonas]MBO0901336.1 endo-1,4-beta-xylanase [Cellulomonas sp. zg-ZUI22]MBO0921782.1 endo-1,4-beta-xylanase [Cellulomonas wangleii]MBO0924796.1 endo-1,4-beta-xylanase [Cellulomonas wangleii]QVI62967.1 endo-1,4-beta-xylanase [Cellulomonas wangleii]
MAATALVAAPLIGLGSAAGAAVADEVLSSTFEESVSPWTGRGAATAARTTDDARTGDASMLVSGRTANWHGASTSITSLFASGGTYQVSAWVKLAPGEADTTVKATVAETPEAWTGVTPDVAVTDDEWVEVAGTYTRAAGVTAGDLYFEAAGETTSFLVDDVVVTGPPFEATPPPGDGTDLSFDFEDGSLSGWAPRATGDGPPTVTVTESGGHESDRALRVSDRVHQGQGVQYDVTDVLSAGAPYQFSAWIRFDGEPGAMTLSARTETGGTSTYSNLVSITGVTEDWTLVTGSFSLPAFETAAEIYLETAWDNDNAGNTSTFLVDDVSITSPTVAVEDLTPLQDTVPFPLGVAIDDRETRGAQSDLLTRHFDQVTAENHMKPYAWYAADRTFGIAPQATAIMDHAVENDLRVYGHVLVWHSQNPGQTDPDPATGTPGNPGWFFFDDDGEPLTSSPEDQEILRERLETHVFAVAKALHDEYGDFGSDTNPLVAWDVVNEVVADGADNPDGLRRSAWFNILGEQFIDLAFRYADEAFNETYAAPGSDRPVKLFINDYNTEETGKQGRYFALVERLLDRGVPLDGVGHQFHVSLTRPIADLRAAIERFEALPVLQAVTELDVATGTPVTDAKLIEQGYYYRDAFDLFREKADSLFSVTVWGLYDSRSWVNDNGAPLLFDDTLTGKPAYYGAAGQDLPAPIRTADVFRGEVPLDDDALTAVEWLQLQPHLLGEEGESGSFQLRWSPTTLTVLLEVAGDAPGVELQVGDETYAFARDGSGDVPGVVSETDGGWTAVIHLPLDDATEGSSVRFNVVVDGGAGWTEPGATGILALLEELSYLEVPSATGEVPVIDGAVDDAWQGLSAVVTGKQVSGTATATAEVRTLWDTDRLFVLMEVTDPDIDLTATQPWEQDSVEIYVDAGNAKNGTYLPTDMQLRINADNAVSFGNGPATQVERVTSATARTETGYVVEVAIDMLDLGIEDSVHGLDFQVNDAAGGARIGTTNWADATNQGYQSTAHWGVGRFVAAEPAPGPATGVPTAPVLSHDNWDKDGTFTVLSSMWWGQNAHTLTLRENGVDIATKRVVDATPGAQIVPFEVTGRVDGTYRYEVVATNQHGSTTSRAITVKVVAAKPGVPVVLHDNWDGNGTYTVSMHMWWGTNATTYRLYEDGVLVDTQALSPNGRNAQHAGTLLEGRKRGVHRYTVELSNEAGTTRSATVPVIVWR